MIECKTFVFQEWIFFYDLSLGSKIPLDDILHAEEFFFSILEPFVVGLVLFKESLSCSYHLVFGFEILELVKIVLLFQSYTSFRDLVSWW